jgi:VanZ family protein
VLTVAFLAYGSFVPFHFAPRPLAEAWHVFRHAIPVRVGVSDFTANLFLMAPFPFLLLGALPWSRAASGRVVPAIGGWLLSTALSTAVELGQTYFPPRHPSLSDIVAQSAGAAVGSVAWVLAGPKAVAWWRRRKARYGPASPAEWILWTYAAALFVARVLPLDLTLSPGTLAYKWRAGRVVSVPFTRLPAEPVHAAAALAAGAAVWVPVSALLVLARRTGGAAHAFLLTVAFAACVEGVRLLVVSRVSDATDLVLAVLGAAMGVSLGSAVAHSLDRSALGRGETGHGNAGSSPARPHPVNDRPSKSASTERE